MGEYEASKPKRSRAAQACDLCRAKKNKCDELYPCTHCKSNYVYQLEEQVKALSAVASLPDDKEDLESSQPTANSAEPWREDTETETSSYDYPHKRLRIDSGDGGRAAKEVSGVNRHTLNVEFYGSSSSVVLLSTARMATDTESIADEVEDEEDLVSSLHNPAFSPGVTTARDGRPTHQSSSGSATHYQQCRPFLDSFFTTLHYIQPILDRADFLNRCVLLWANNTSHVGQSFIALYYSVLSLGALVSIREDEDIDGIGNLQWSRMFFEEARSRTGLNMVTDIEMVQCYFFLAKVCQNELNPHAAYMYGGLAVRTALAIGINREPQLAHQRDPRLSKAGSRTWWTLYSLEIEMSFSLGRPDSLGADVYHNRQYPAIKGNLAYSERAPELLDFPHCAIIKAMVDFSRITKNVVSGIYLAETTLEKIASLAREIGQDLDRWLQELPAQIRPEMAPERVRPLSAAKEPQYAKKQKLVLKIRYHNLRILLFGYFLTKSSISKRASMTGFQEEVTKCIDSAKQTIEIIYQACQYHDFFRTWFYNTTYTLFAASIILIYISRESSEAELTYLYKLVEMAVEILEIMDESVVASKAAKMIQGALERARTRSPGGSGQIGSGEFDMMGPWNGYAGLFDFIDGDMGIGLPFPLGDPTAALHPAES
ncbi:hypothetical protein GQ53DRAFT_648828 [Thozetella sp. PMI_491]|nr:hypothetical protein GQ53DRAFT_648828 [Thozetella sp. PMI_491]